MFLVAEVRLIDGTSVGVIVLDRYTFSTRADPTGRPGWRGAGMITVGGEAHQCRIQAVAVAEPVVAEASSGSA